MDPRQRQFLHVGCSTDNRIPWVFAGWREIRLDIDPAVRPDIVASITDMHAVADASVDAVYSSHNLEHLEAHQVPLALSEFRRVLKPDGWLLLVVPDLQSVAELVAADRLCETVYETPGGPIAPIDIIYGHRGRIAAGNGFMAHRTGFTARVLAAAMQAAGFERVAMQRALLALWVYGLPTAATTPCLPHPRPMIAADPVPPAVAD